MDINKRLKQKHKKIARQKRIENIIYKALKPLIILSEHIEDKKYKKIETIREAGRNMSMDEAADIAIEIIIDKLIKWEEEIDFVVANYAYEDYSCFTAFQWLLRYLPRDERDNKYKMLKSYIYKNKTFDESAIDIIRDFTETIYKKIKNVDGLKVGWVIDKEKYGYFKSRSYEKTLVIGLEGDVVNVNRIN